MTDKFEINPDEAGANPGGGVAVPDLKAWFVDEVLPLEAALMQFLRRSGRSAQDVADLRQEIYLRVCESAKHQVPRPVRPFVFTIARNLLIDQMRRDHVIPIDAVFDLEALNVATDVPGPDRNVMARDELRRLHVALDELPPRSREVVVLRRIIGLSREEIATRMNISEATVTKHLVNGLKALANLLYAETEATRRIE